MSERGHYLILSGESTRTTEAPIIEHATSPALAPDPPFTLTQEIARTPSAARLQRPFRFEDQP